MKVRCLTTSGLVYTCNSYFLTGDWNRVEYVNTLVDPGRDPVLIESLLKAPTGVGQKRLQQIIVTHSHYDHVELVLRVKQMFCATVYAFSPAMEGVDVLLEDGMTVPAGDGSLEVIHIPGHSSDSICLYDKDRGTLFSGDTPVSIQSPDANYGEVFVTAFRRLCGLNITTIYPGHGEPLTEGCHAMLCRSLAVMEGSPAA